MVAHLERRRSRAAKLARRIAVFAVVLFAVSTLGHRFSLLETPGFLWVFAIVVALALAALVLAGFGLRSAWLRGAEGAASAALAIVLAVLLLSPSAYLGFLATRYPMLHDISTDLAEPPVFRSILALRGPAMNALAAPSPEAAASQREAYPDVVGRRYEVPVEKVVQAVERQVAARGWATLPLRTPPPEGETDIEATVRTPVFGFVDDVVLRVTDEGDTTFVDMRSSSRFGRHDYGNNARRVIDFLKDLDLEVAAQAGA